MPELPEVETTVRGLAKVMEGRRVAHLQTRRGDLRRPFPVDLAQRMVGARISNLSRRAKYGLIETDRADVMIFHLGMSGRWRIDPDDLGKHDHLVIDLDGGMRLSLCDPRRFGSVDIVTAEALPHWPPIAALGPEPLGPDFTGRYLKDRLAGRAASIKAMLLDQRIVAGLGNIYVCEALHLAGIAPARAAGRIALARLDRLVEGVHTVLRASIAAGGSSLRNYARPDGELGYFAKEWRVYGREGEPCACGGTVARYVEGGRSTFWCPRCQH